MLDQLLGTELFAAVAALLGALVVLVYRYYRGEPVGFDDLPFDEKFALARSLRKEYAVRGEPNTLRRLGDEDELAEITNRFAGNGYIPKWPFSFHYRGEVENLVRYYYDPRRDLPHRQFHVRLFVENGETLAYAHEEPFGLNHPDAHVASEDMTDVTEWVADAYETSLGGDGDALDPRLWAAE